MKKLLTIFGLFYTLGLCAEDNPPQSADQPSVEQYTRKSSTPSPSEPFFPKPSYFRKHFGQPNTRVELQPPIHLAEFIADGKLELSLKNYLDLVMANNGDITIQKLLIEPFRNQITRAFGIFDPVGTASFSSTRVQSPASDALAGATTLNQLTQPLRLNYFQTLPTGTQYNIFFNGLKSSTNSAFATFNPSIGTNLNFNIAQPLLRGRGGQITRLPITIARSRLRANEYFLEDQVIQLLTFAENVYWNVVEARENLRVQEKSLELADAALKRAKRELELGATSPLEIYQPEAVYANAEIFVTQSRYRLAQSEDSLRRQMGADLDPSTQRLPIVLTESVDPPTGTLKIDPEAEVVKGLAVRQDLKAVKQNLDSDDLFIKLANDALRPDLSLTAQYGSSGRGGTFYQRNNVFDIAGNRNTIVNVLPGGVADALDTTFGFGFPVYGFGLSLRLPIRDRRAAADLADSLVNKKIDTMRARVVEENIRLQVLTAVNNVENSKASVELAKVARDLAQKRVDADQKRYDLGTTTIFFVLASQNDLTVAESNLVTQSINYRRNLLQLLQRTGQLLEERGVRIQ